MPKPKSHRKDQLSLPPTRQKSKKLLGDVKTTAEKIKERREEEKKFMRRGTRVGRKWFHESHEHYAHAHQHENVHEKKHSKLKINELEKKREKAEREMAERIADMDKETENRLNDLKRIGSLTKLSKVKRLLVDEEAKLEIMEQKVSMTMRESLLKKKRTKWLKERRKRVKSEIKGIDEKIRELEKNVKGKSGGKREKLGRILSFPGRKLRKAS